VFTGMGVCLLVYICSCVLFIYRNVHHCLVWFVLSSEVIDRMSLVRC